MTAPPARRRRTRSSSTQTTSQTERSDESQARDRACREIGNAAALGPYTKRERSANLTGDALDRYIRNGLTTFWHQSGTAKMGRDAMSVVDSKLKVHGLEGLRVADASILPHLPTSFSTTTVSSPW